MAYASKPAYNGKQFIVIEDDRKALHWQTAYVSLWQHFLLLQSCGIMGSGELQAQEADLGVQADISELPLSLIHI